MIPPDQRSLSDKQRTETRDEGALRGTALGPWADLVKVECIACGHVELLTLDKPRIKGLAAPAVHSGSRFGTAAPLPRWRPSTSRWSSIPTA